MRGRGIGRGADSSADLRVGCQEMSVGVRCWKSLSFFCLLIRCSLLKDCEDGDRYKYYLALLLNQC